MDTNRTLRILSLIFKILCITACSVQVCIVLFTYFSYHQGTKTEFEFPKYFPPKGLSQCYRYRDIIDTGKLAVKYDFPPGWKFIKGEHPNPTIDLVHSAVTIGDIFEFTPAADDFVESCTIHTSNNSVIPIVFPRSECLKFFQVKKYFMQEFICYRILWKILLNLNFEVIGASFFYGSILYEIKINRNIFHDTYIVMPLLHDQSPPFFTRYFASSIRKGSSYNHSEDYRLSYTNLRIHNLGFPYSAEDCQQNLNFQLSRQPCMKQCINEKIMKMYNRVSTEFIYEEPLDSRHLSHIEFKNSSFLHEYDNIQGQCRGICILNMCSYYYTLTTVDWNLKPNDTKQEK